MGKMKVAIVAVLLTALSPLRAQVEPPDDRPVRRAEPVEAPGQEPEIRRAEPYRPEEPPTPPAIPFEEEAEAPAPTPPPRPEPTPTPKPPPKPTPTPKRESEPEGPPIAPGTMGERQLQIANNFYAREMYDLAAPEYEKYLGQYVDAEHRPTALFRLGESYRKLGNRAGAKNAYQSLLLNYNEGPFVAPGAFRLADLLFEDENFSQAHALYERAVAKSEEPAVKNAARFFAGRTLEKLHRSAEARGQFESVIRAEGDNPYRDAARLALAKLLLDARRDEEAVKQFEALSKDADKPALRAEAAVRTALLRIDMKQLDRAAADLERALKMPEIGEWREPAQIALIRVLYEAEKYAETVKNFEQASGSLSEKAKPELMMLAANAHRRLGDHGKARALYDQVLEAYPGTKFADEARYTRLVSIYNAGEDGLFEAVDEFVATDPDPQQKAQAQLLKAESLFRAKSYAEAVPAYEVINRSDLPAAMRPDALFKYAWSVMESGGHARAAEVFQKFLEEYPGHDLAPTALAQRAVALQRANQFSLALETFDQLIEKYPKARERELALQQKALILGQQQENKAMTETFAQLLKEFPESAAAAQANYWIGWAAFEGKAYREAVEALDKARELDAGKFFERATLRIMLAEFYLGNRDAVAANVDRFLKEETGGKVPAEILRWLGGQYAEAKDFEAAARYLAELTAREEERTAADWLALARARLELKECADAKFAIGPYLETTAEPAARARGLLTLGEAELCMKNLDNAAAAAEEALSLQPEGALNAQGRMLTGDVSVARGGLDEAAKIYLSLAVVYEDPVVTPQALHKAYMAYERLGETEKAGKTLNDLQTRYPEYSQAIDLAR